MKICSQLFFVVTRNNPSLISSYVACSNFRYYLPDLLPVCVHAHPLACLLEFFWFRHVLQSAFCYKLNFTRPTLGNVFAPLTNSLGRAIFKSCGKFCFAAEIINGVLQSHCLTSFKLRISYI